MQQNKQNPLHCFNYTQEQTVDFLNTASVFCVNCDGMTVWHNTEPCSVTKVPDEDINGLIDYIKTKPQLLKKLQIDAQTPVANNNNNNNSKKAKKQIEAKEVVNNRPCKKCIHHSGGFIHEYEWQDCKKNWSDKPNGLFYGVIKDTCANWHLRKE